MTFSHLPEADACWRFLRACGNAPEAAFASDALQRSYARLLEGTFGARRVAIARRRPSLCHDGTPVVYSCALCAKERDRPGTFRMLAEPGGTGIAVHQQIDFSLRLLDDLLGEWGWRAAAADVNSVVSEVFPAEPEKVDDWWGGIWLGMVVAAAVELRVYFNLRSGTPESRWQRLAGVLGHFGDDRLRDPLQRLADQVAPHAIPVGIGAVITGGVMPVLRLYAGVHQAHREVIQALIPQPSEGKRRSVDEMFDAFDGVEGIFGSQSVTMGYDFRRDVGGTIIPTISRTKVDLSCQYIAAERSSTAIDRTRRLAGLWGAGEEVLERFTSDLTACFGGFEVEYVSASIKDGPPGLTIYAKPHACSGY